MRVRPALSVGAATVACATALVGLHAGAADAAAVCSVNYVVNQWSTGFTADVTLTNTGPAVTSWTLGWTFAGDQQVSSGWNARVGQSGRVVTASDAGWNGALATGASASFGFQATYSGTNAAPATFTLNGISCNEEAPPPPSTPPPSTPPPSGACPAQAVCDDFESQPAGAPGGRWAVAFPDCRGTGTATVDRTTGHGGTTSLRVNGTAGYCNHVFVRGAGLLDRTGDQVYVRYWVRHTTALPAAHITTVALNDAADGGRDLRFGGQNGALQWNRASDDATLPEQSPAGVAQSRPLPVDTWTCVEFKVDRAGGTMQTWLNGASVPGLLQDGVPTRDIDSQWLNRTYRPNPTDLRLGWESYGEGADTLWYDDVAAGSVRIGC